MADSTMTQDFLAGIDPTGVVTFRNATKNEKDHGKHKLVGNIGGFLGGYVLSTGLGAAGMAATALAIKKKAPALSEYLGQGAKDSLKAINPFSAVKSLKNIKKSTQIVDDTTKYISKADKAYKNSMMPGHVPDTKMLSNDFKGVSDLQKSRVDFGKATGLSPERNLSEGIGIVGGIASGVLGGGLNALSAETQYNTALALKEKNNKEKASLKKKASFFTKVGALTKF